MLTPTGPISRPKHALRAMVARIDAFREAVGADDAAGAEEHVYLNAAVIGGDRPRPYAVVSLPDDANEFETLAAGDQHYLSPAGTLWLYLTMDADRDAPYGDNSATRFENWLGAIWQALRGMAGRDDLLPIESLGWALRPKITSPSSGFAKPFWLAIVEVRWK